MNGKLQRFYEGICTDAYTLFGAHLSDTGCTFTVYAPNARAISVIGSFNDWDPNRHAMNRRIDNMDIWELTIEGVKEWDAYKYHIIQSDGMVIDKADPYAFYSETRPETASKVVSIGDYKWSDRSWMRKRTKGFDKPISIYEVYAGGWKKNGEYEYSYDMLREELIPYVKEHGFTHIEFMPLTEYPFDGSWGYQASGYYALTSRYGNPKEFSAFIDACHAENIGVIIDMVPVHFVKDIFGLARFDGTAVYEYPQIHDAESQWGTLNFDLGKNTVRSFLISSAMYWLDMYHIDGIRMDAVANMIYWGGNRSRGVNDGAVDFIRVLNKTINQAYPNVMMIAEDSTDFPNVTASIEDGGLGFDYKWDLGWMNDTLRYFETDPIYRIYHHNQLTFSMAYFYSEKFLMPFSHDENVHSKKTIVDRMWGTYDQKFAQVRSLYAYMFAHPGKKLNFMGNEIASFREFDEKKELDWFLLKYPRHDAFLAFFKDLNDLYTSHSALWKYDYEPKGFRWIEPDDGNRSIYSFYREDEKELIVCVMNLAGGRYEDYECHVPLAGSYREILNTDDTKYDGEGYTNTKLLKSKKIEEDHRGFNNEIHLRLAPFSSTWLRITKRKKEK